LHYFNRAVKCINLVRRHLSNAVNEEILQKLSSFTYTSYAKIIFEIF